MSHVERMPTEEEQQYMASLLSKVLPKLPNNEPYSWEEYFRRHKIVEYLWDRKFRRG